MTRPTSASDRAYLHVKRQVLAGGYDGGDLITEGQVAQALDISRTPVREAFLRLEVEGLLRLYPKRGALVVPVSPREIDEVVEARLLLEEFAARKVARTDGLGEVVARMRDVIKRQRAAAAAGRPDDFSDLDREFHAAVLRAAGNTILARQYDGLRDRQVRMNIATLTNRPGRFEQILTEHTALCDALSTGALERYVALLGAHVSRTGELARHPMP
jgi:DNA-binding GntR family transcriptional regulator